jgi:hypothetical protein
METKTCESLPAQRMLRVSCVFQTLIALRYGLLFSVLRAIDPSSLGKVQLALLRVVVRCASLSATFQNCNTKTVKLDRPVISFCCPPWPRSRGNRAR